MSIYKKFFAFFAASVAAVSLSVTAFAVIKHRPSDFLSYTYQSNLSYSKYNAKLSTGTITSTNSNYDSSWKSTVYIVYGQNSSGYYKISADSDSGTAKTISCNPQFDSSEAARRYYVGKLLLTKNNTSSIVNTHTIDIRKDQ